MIQITFVKDRERNVVCNSSKAGIHLVMNQDTFKNREYRFCEETFLFDGYSIWFQDQGNLFREMKNFTLSFVFAPLCYSEQGDGLFSFFDENEKKGLYVLLSKFGKIQVGFGNGTEIFRFASINAHVEKYQWNTVTIVFRKDAGWCDLYINGIFSNRKQFRRHVGIEWPESKAYLGKYVNHKEYHETSGIGCFYGFMKEMVIHKECLTDEAVKKMYSSCSIKNLKIDTALNRNAYKDDVQRPQYHLIPPGKWMNEPHAPMYFDGYYHIFHQANPHAPIFNNLQWGHFISTDMVHWKDMPLALETEDNHLDPDGCWSGSALVDKEGIPRIFYTAGNHAKFPNQSIALATAIIEPDKKLEKWEKYPVSIVEQTEGWLGEFRDPFVWLEDDTYFMLVGTGDADNGGGNAVLYSSEDMINWQTHGFILDYDYEKNKEAGHVWELPVLLPLRAENGEIAAHILLLCACQIEDGNVETYAFVGKWNAAKKKFEKFHERALLLDLGYGTFTGPSGFVTPDNRTVVFTIAQGHRKPDVEFHSGWAHNGGLPMELFIKNQELHLRPIREIYGLKKKQILKLENVTVEEANQYLDQIAGNRFWMKVCADADYMAVETTDINKKKVVYYDKKNGRLGVMDEKGNQIGKYRGEIDLVDIGEEPVVMEYFLDHSMIEVYLNERKSVTHRNYIEGSDRKIKLAGTIYKIQNLELWEMDSAY